MQRNAVTDGTGQQLHVPNAMPMIAVQMINCSTAFPASRLANQLFSDGTIENLRGFAENTIFIVSVEIPNPNPRNTLTVQVMKKEKIGHCFCNIGLMLVVTGWHVSVNHHPRANLNCQCLEHASLLESGFKKLLARQMASNCCEHPMFWNAMACNCVRGYTWSVVDDVTQAAETPLHGSKFTGRKAGFLQTQDINRMLSALNENVYCGPNFRGPPRV